MTDRELYRRLWGPDGPRGPGYRLLSLLLAPAEALYRVGIAARNLAYDRGVLPSREPSLASLVVGNLAVGGTGKTPITAWFAAELAKRGRRPTIVLRGYGGDEVQVHRVLNPSIPVLPYPRRLAGVRRASELGADVVVLDDAFQHRAVRGHANVVLLSAEDGLDSPRLLPRGPWREPLKALSRATLVVVTRKRAGQARARGIEMSLAQRWPSLPRAGVHLRLTGLAPYSESAGLGAPVGFEGAACRLVVAGVARPDTVRAQLAEVGASVGRFEAYPNHHRYTRADVERIERGVKEGPLVTTLKDAVKLAPLLRARVPLYVLLQEVEWEWGREAMERELDGLVKIERR